MKIGRLARALLPLFMSILATGLAAQAADNDAPRAVVKQVLAGLTKAGTNLNNPTYDPCPKLCDPAFSTIMTQMDMLQKEDPTAAYDYDVFCQCQDYDNQTFSLVSDRMTGTSRYEATVRGSDKDTKPWKYVLAPVGGTWRITDVIDESGSVRAGMLRALKGK